MIVMEDKKCRNFIIYHYDAEGTPSPLIGKKKEKKTLLFNARLTCSQQVIN